MDLHLLIHLIQSLHKSLWLLLYTSPGLSAWLSLPCINMRKGYLVIPHHSTSFSNCLHSLVYRWLKVEHLVSYDVDLDTNGHFKSCYVRMHSISCKNVFEFFLTFLQTQCRIWFTFKHFEIFLHAYYKHDFKQDENKSQKIV